MKNGTFALVAALMLVCGGSAAVAQSYGNTSPARADTTDPNSTPSRTTGSRGSEPRADVDARGHRGARVSHRAVRHRDAVSSTEAKPDPALQAQRDTAMFMGAAMNPWQADSNAPAKH